MESKFEKVEKNLKEKENRIAQLSNEIQELKKEHKTIVQNQIKQATSQKQHLNVLTRHQAKLKKLEEDQKAGAKVVISIANCVDYFADVAKENRKRIIENEQLTKELKLEISSQASQLELITKAISDQNSKIKAIELQIGKG